jgi:predicted alpha/beta-hydrolase family hydrolase
VKAKHPIDVVLLPGFGGAADQPILLQLERRLAGPTFACRRLAPPRGKLEPSLSAQTAWLEERLAEAAGPHVAIGRSFGGRLCVRVAARVELRACVLLGFPVRPPGKQRPLDEAALAALRCPTLIIQGSQDELGPLKVLRPILKANPRLELHVLEGGAHAWSAAQQREGLDLAAKWLTTAGDAPRSP